MSTATFTPPSLSPVIKGGIPIPLVLPRSFTHFLLPITARGCSYLLDAPLIEEPIIETNKLITKSAIDENVILILTLVGRQVENGSRFLAESYTLHCKITEPRARPQFVAATVLSVFGFAGRIGLTISDLGIETSLDFKLPLAEISAFLKKRQIAYKLLIIERATGKEFGWPELCTSEELGHLIRINSAIVDRAFMGPVDPVLHKVPATKEALLWLESYEQSPKQEFALSAFTSKLFGQFIQLGNVRITVEDAYIVNSERVRSELSTNDGHEVEVVVSSRSGIGLYKTPEAPLLPDSPWDSKLKALISLEEPLDEELIERYNALAAATLLGATDEEKEIMTARSELDDEEFSADN